MRVLMIAPHPVFSPRGTPISVYNRALVLGALGHQVDLVTYPVGTDRPAPNLTYHRGRGRGRTGARPVRIGMSAAKVAYNSGLALRALRFGLARRRSIDVVHSHEEGALVGVIVARVLGVPHVYDMGNGWGTVLANFGVGPSSPAVALADRLESSVVRASQLVISQVPAVHHRSLSAGISTSHYVPNASVEVPAEPGAGARTRADLGVAPGAALVVYAGSFERYQGLEMLFLALADPLLRGFPIELAMVGGTDDQVMAAEATVTSLGAGAKVHFIGMVDPGAISSYLDAADVLVSPRLTGSNTPLKLYSYLQAGKPIVATDIVSHTQVLDGTCAEIVAADAPSFAAGIGRVLRSPERATSLAAGASRLAERHSLASFVEATDTAYHLVGGPAPDTSRTRSATDRIVEVLTATAPASTPHPDHHAGSVT